MPAKKKQREASEDGAESVGACDIEEQIEKLRRWYTEEIERKNKIISELKEQNMALLKSSLKISERLSEMQGLRKHRETKPKGRKGSEETEKKGESIEQKALKKLMIEANKK